jgi:hypothetical protein
MYSAGKGNVMGRAPTRGALTTCTGFNTDSLIPVLFKDGFDNCISHKKVDSKLI